MTNGEERRLIDDPAAPYLIEFVEVRPLGARIGITPCPGTAETRGSAARNRGQGRGLGRSGTVGACLLVQLGEDPRVAIDRIRRARPGAIETIEQERYVLARRL